MIICDECKHSFENNNNFIRHVNLTHSHLKRFFCTEPDCQKTFSLVDTFIKHIKRKHDNKKNIFLLLDENLPTMRFNNDTGDFDSDDDFVDLEKMFICNSSDSSDCESFIDDNNEDKGLSWLHKNNESEVNLFDISENVESENDTIKFAAKLYEHSDIPRNRVESIITETSGLLKSTLTSIKNELCEISKMSPCNDDHLNKHNIEKVFNKHLKPFENMQTEKQRLSKFQSYNTFIPPISYKIGERTEYKAKPTGATRTEVPVTAQFIPIRKVLQKFLELPNVFNKTMNYINSLNSCTQTISNIVQSTFWKNKAAHFKDKIVLPLILYFDDYENNNPLGSHKGISKCGAVYVTIPCLPPEFQSKVENIFLFILFNTLDRSTFKNTIIFQKVIEELTFLRDEGIIIHLETGDIRVYFDLTLIVGDNLGIHSIFGFVESFRAKKFCRFCLIDNANINNVLKESDCILRDPQNYESLKNKNNPQLSGIKEDCIFNKIPGFHVTENPGVDVMHDFLEGICRYDIALVLNYFIYKRKYFDLQELNTKIRAFYYGANKNINKPPEITESNLKNNCIILSSAEMLNLIRNLNLIIGLSIPENDDHLNLILLLQEILQIVCSTKIKYDTPKLLELKIKEYLILLREKFPDYNLKPKHHFLLHYPSIMKKIGPLWNVCCMRFESKHQEGKKISRSAICRVNVCKTIALRHQLIFNYRLISKSSSYPTYFCNRIKMSSLKNLPNASNFVHLLPSSFVGKSISLTNSIQYKGKKIKEDSVIVTFSELGSEYYLVYLIILNGDDDFFIVTKSLTDCYLNERLRAVKIYDQDCFFWEILSMKDLQSSIISYINKLSDGSLYISKNWM